MSEGGGGFTKAKRTLSQEDEIIKKKNRINVSNFIKLKADAGWISGFGVGDPRK